MIKYVIFFLLISNVVWAQEIKYDFVYCTKETGDYELFLGRLDRKHKKQITKRELRDGYAAVSPDGEKNVMPIMMIKELGVSMLWILMEVIVNGSLQRKM